MGLHLRQRLMVEDWYHRHPEIEDEDLGAPLFDASESENRFTWSLLDVLEKTVYQRMS